MPQAILLSQIFYCFKSLMSLAKLLVWESVFNFPLVTIHNDTTNRLSKLEFDDKCNTFARKNIKKFLCKCKHNITDVRATCRLFSLTLKG